MERVCRRCGRVYRGLVCHACHPRRKAEAKAEVEHGGVDAGADDVTGEAAAGGRSGVQDESARATEEEGATSAG
jgi:hypothetical protein